MLKARFHSFEDAEQFIDELQLFAHSKTSFVFSKVV